MAGVDLLQAPILRRSTTLPVSELTKLFVEGDKRRNAVSVDLRCCAYSTGRITIVRSVGSESALLDISLEVVRNDRFEEQNDNDRCLCLCHTKEASKPNSDSNSQPVFLPAPVKGKPKIQLTRGSLFTQRKEIAGLDVLQTVQDNGSEASSSEVNVQFESEELVPPEGIPCEFCDKVFVSASTLLKHTTKHHPKVSHSDAEPDVADISKESKAVTGKEPIIVQNDDGTSVITVPPDFWKDEDLEKNDAADEEDDDATIIDGEDERSNHSFSHSSNDNDIDNDEEDVIHSLHDVMNDFIEDTCNEDYEVVHYIQGPADDLDEEKDDGKDENISQQEKNKRRRKGNDVQDEQVAKKAKQTPVSDTYKETIVTKKRNRQERIAEEIIEIDDSESEIDCVDQRSPASINSQNENVGKSMHKTDSCYLRPIMSARRDKVDKNIQTVPTNKLSTNTSKAGKVLSCSGIFKAGRTNNISRSILLDISRRSKVTQTGKRYVYKGKVLYPSIKSPKKQTEDEEPMFDCTFHKFCLVNKTKFYTKDELTKHIVSGFRNQPHVATERRAPSTYYQKRKEQTTESETGQSAKESTSNIESTSEISENSFESEIDKLDPIDKDRFYTKEELGKQIVTGLISSSADAEDNEDNEFDCPVCSSRFSTPSSLYEHIQSDHAQAMFSNTHSASAMRRREGRNQQLTRKQDCQKSSISVLPGALAEQEGDKILLSTKELTEVVYPCPVCRAIFYHDFELESHIKSEHQTVGEDTSDIDNDAVETDESNNPITKMMIPAPIASKKRKNNIDEDESESCGKASTSGTHQVQQAGMARCPICPSNLAMFGNVNDLQLHLTETHGVQAKVVNLADKKSADNSMSKYGGHYECPVCALLFSTSSDMYAHLNSTHIRHVTKTWKCIVKRGQKRPAETVQPNTGELYQCTKCDKMFATKGHMMKHAESMH